MKFDRKAVHDMALENTLLKRKCERYHQEVEGKMDEIAALKTSLDQAVEAIPEDAAFIVITIKGNVKTQDAFVKYAEKFAEPFKEKFEGRIFMIPDNVSIKALNDFGMLERLAELSPEIAKILSKSPKKE